MCACWPMSTSTCDTDNCAISVALWTLAKKKKQKNQFVFTRLRLSICFSYCPLILSIFRRFLHFISSCFLGERFAHFLWIHASQCIVQCITSGAIHWIFVVSLVNESARNRKQNVEKVWSCERTQFYTKDNKKMRRRNCASSSPWLFQSHIHTHCTERNLEIDNSQVE